MRTTPYSPHELQAPIAARVLPLSAVRALQQAVLTDSRVAFGESRERAHRLAEVTRRLKKQHPQFFR